MRDPIVDPEHRELEEALIRAGRDVGMSPELRAKTLAALGVGSVAATGLIASKSGLLGWLSSKSGIAWAGLVGSLGIAGAVVLSQRAPSKNEQVETNFGTGEKASLPSPEDEEPTRAPGSAPAPGSDGSADSRVQAESEQQAEPAPPVEAAQQDRQEQDEEEQSSAASSPALKVNAPPSPKLGLREEISHLSQVEAALRAHNTAGALALLGQYRTRFSRPQMALEAEVLTIQALYEAGSVAEAKSRARRFLERYPQSPLGTRAKRYLRE